MQFWNGDFWSVIWALEDCCIPKLLLFLVLSNSKSQFQYDKKWVKGLDDKNIFIILISKDTTAASKTLREQKLRVVIAS